MVVAVFVVVVLGSCTGDFTSSTVWVTGGFSSSTMDAVAAVVADTHVRFVLQIMTSIIRKRTDGRRVMSQTTIFLTEVVCHEKVLAQ